MEHQAPVVEVADTKRGLLLADAVELLLLKAWDLPLHLGASTVRVIPHHCLMILVDTMRAQGAVVMVIKVDEAVEVVVVVTEVVEDMEDMEGMAGAVILIHLSRLCLEQICTESV